MRTRLHADNFSRACRGEPVDHIPVWFMRQAGRSLPEYRELRSRHGILEICHEPELAAEATMQPVRRLGVDAAILFSDIVVVLRAMGVELDIVPGRGPVIAAPIRDEAGIEALHPLEGEGVTPVNQAIALLVDELDVPLIGFAGAPFTLASYLIEGGPSRDFVRTKTLMLSRPELWDRLMEHLAHATIEHLRGQIRHGVAAVQLFDSWAGALTRDQYSRYAAPATRTILHALAGEGVPRIHFGVGTSAILDLMGGTEVDVMGVDWRLPLDEARRRLPAGIALQGNLDPAVVMAPWMEIERSVRDVLRRGGGTSHVFNLGHGVHPTSDPDVLARIVDLVHSLTTGDTP